MGQGNRAATREPNREHSTTANGLPAAGGSDREAANYGGGGPGPQCEGAQKNKIRRGQTRPYAMQLQMASAPCLACLQGKRWEDRGMKSIDVRIPPALRIPNPSDSANCLAWG
jgi:hypothetical protein